MADHHAGRRCEVVVVGDAGTGKSSLIIAVATDSFPDHPPPVLPPTRLPLDFYPDRVPLTIVDTSSRTEDGLRLHMDCRRAHVVVLTYACDRVDTLERLATFWLPELRRLEIEVPVIVVGCKLDLRDDRQCSLEQIICIGLMQEFRKIETCIECSALKQIQIAEVFYYAQKTILHPTAPLFDQATQTLKPRCVRALKRIFTLCDRDKDGALNVAELNDFQVKCFNAPLQPSEIEGVKNVVSEKMAEGVNPIGLTLTGFLFLHTLFIEKGRLETTWTVLRKYGYDDEIQLRDDLLQNPCFKRSPDASVELTEKALEFLKEAFFAFDADVDCALRSEELEELFSTAPSCPWFEAPYSDAAETNQAGALTLDGFLSLWALMTLLEPRKSLAHLIYIGYPEDPPSAFRITSRRRRDRKRQRSDRVVFQCYVFGATKCGKSSLLNALKGRVFSDLYEHTKGTRCAVNVVEQTGVLALFEAKVEGPKRETMKRAQVAGLGLGAANFFLYGSWGLNYWYGGKLASAGEVTFADVLQTFFVLVSTGRVLAEAGALAPDLAKGSQAIASVFNILDRDTEIDADKPDAKKVESVEGHIELRGVQFCYPARPDVMIFKDFNLSVRAGQTVAMVGQSGSGKSTIIGLIERFYDPVKGKVLIDGRDIKTLHLQSLRRHIGLVSQEPTLFAGTLRENIAYGKPDATETEVTEAAIAANAHNFISALPKGYETFAGERGLQLSGGQKQRIAIARAVLKNPAILLLDEATSALDAESERVVQDALDRMMVGRTTVVVAHRLSTIASADTIAVMQDGVILEQGSHEELMSKGESSAYYSLVRLQTSSH